MFLSPSFNIFNKKETYDHNIFHNFEQVEFAVNEGDDVAVAEIAAKSKKIEDREQEMQDGTKNTQKTYNLRPRLQISSIVVKEVPNTYVEAIISEDKE